MGVFSRRLGLPILFALLVAAVWADPLWTGRNFGGRDLSAYNLPMEKAIHDSYRNGRLPIWVPEISGGRPLLPNPNAGALYPVRPLLALLPFPFAARLASVFHWALAAIGLALLLARLGVSTGARWVGGVTYAFSGVAVSELFFPHVQPGMALLPWVLWALDRTVRPVSRGTLLLALILVCVLLAGDIFTAGLALLGVLLWILLETPPPNRRASFATAGIGIGLAAAAVAPQLVATALWIPHTSRAIVGMRLGEALTFSLSPWRLLEMVVPYPFGATWSLEDGRIWGWTVFRQRPVGLHSTLYAGAFAVFSAGALWRSRARGVRFAKHFLWIGLALSILPGLLPHGWESQASPVALRNPEKFAVAATLSLAVLAGLGVDWFRREPLRSRFPLAVGALFAVWTLLAVYLPEAHARAAIRAVRAGPQFVGTAAREIPSALAEAGILWIATFVAIRLLPRPGIISRATAMLMLTVVPIAATRRIGLTFRQEEIFPPTAFARRIERLDPSGSYRTLGESAYGSFSRVEQALTVSDPAYVAGPRRHWLEHTQLLWGRGTVFNDDFDRGDLARVERLRVVSKIAARHPRADVFFGNLSLRFGIRFRDQDALRGYRPFGGDPLQSWDALSPAFPDMRLLERWREESSPIAALNRIPFQQPGEIVIESGRTSSGTARGGTLRVVEKGAHRVHLTISSPDPTWLFVLRGYWPYREVLVDGRRTSVSTAQIAFSAIAVPAGTHDILWTEQVPGLRVSVWATVAAFMLAIWILRAERRQSEGMTDR